MRTAYVIVWVPRQLKALSCICMLVLEGLTSHMMFRVTHSTGSAIAIIGTPCWLFSGWIDEGQPIEQVKILIYDIELTKLSKLTRATPLSALLQLQRACPSVAIGLST